MKNIKQVFALITVLALLTVIFSTNILAAGEENTSGYGMTYTAQPQAFAASPVDNPIKGFLPFKNSGSNNLPYSMEWFYLPLSSLMDGPNSYTFDKEYGFEQTLSDIASRGHQAALMLFCDWPGSDKTGRSVPQFVWDMGVAKLTYTDLGGGIAPDYDDQRLIDVIKNFLTEFGKRYDGDPRLAYYNVGLIGHWGEWHMGGSPAKMPSTEQQSEVIKAADNAFNKTKILLRYPNAAYSNNMTNDGSCNVGFADFSFTQDTIGNLAWYFMKQITAVGATDKWKTESIGGEFRPEGQAPFINGTPLANYQDYDQCVTQTHATWMLFANAFNINFDTPTLERMSAASKKLGYDLTVNETTAVLPSINNLNLSVEIDNIGVAPFYYKWPVKIALLDSSNKIAKEFVTDWDIRAILPNSPVSFNTALNLTSVSIGEYSIAMKVVNPISNGKILKFANNTQDANLTDWLTLGTISKTSSCKGDLNGDTKVTTVDALMTLNIASGRKIPGQSEITAADVTGDGKVTTVDALKILQFASGRRTSFD